MARYNHFTSSKYAKISFGLLPIGEKFRMDKRRNGRTIYDVVMVKTGELSYEELKSKRPFTLVDPELIVSDYKQLVSTT